MKKNLLVTLADENYIDQAKQLFSSVYWNASWKGDYMLLAHEIPEQKLKWFRDKGILVKKCNSILTEELDIRYSVITSKFYVFISEFKQWERIIYLDSDIIVRASLDSLLDINSFAAVLDIRPKLRHQFQLKHKKEIRSKLMENYDLNRPGFNAGVMVFNTNIIKEETFSDLIKLSRMYPVCGGLVDQPIINLYFHNNFTTLPCVYNCRVDYMMWSCNIKPQNIKGIILHLIDQKPCSSKNPFYNEWKNNLDKAEFIELKSIPPAHENWTKMDIENYCLYLKKRSILYFYRHIYWRIYRKIIPKINNKAGLIGIFLKKQFPNLYYMLKRFQK